MYRTTVDDVTDHTNRYRQAAIAWLHRVTGGQFGEYTVNTAAVLGGIAGLLGLAMAVLAALSGLVRLAAMGVAAGWDQATSLAGWVAARPEAHLVTEPVTNFFIVHGAGLPVEPARMVLLWGLGGAILAGLAFVARSRGAQIGWPLYGAATVALAGLGTETTGNGLVAAAAIVLAWCLVSVLVLRRPLFG